MLEASHALPSGLNEVIVQNHSTNASRSAIVFDAVGGT